MELPSRTNSSLAPRVTVSLSNGGCQNTPSYFLDLPSGVNCPNGTKAADQWKLQDDEDISWLTSGASCYTYLVAWGSGIAMYGAVGPDYGDYSCKLDNEEAVWHSAKASAVNNSAILCAWDNLSCANHTAIVTNSPAGGKSLGFSLSIFNLAKAPTLTNPKTITAPAGASAAAKSQPLVDAGEAQILAAYEGAVKNKTKSGNNTGVPSYSSLNGTHSGTTNLTNTTSPDSNSTSTNVSSNSTSPSSSTSGSSDGDSSSSTNSNDVSTGDSSAGSPAASSTSTSDSASTSWPFGLTGLEFGGVVGAGVLLLLAVVVCVMMCSRSGGSSTQRSLGKKKVTAKSLPKRRVKREKMTKDLKRKRGEAGEEEATRPPYKQRVLVLSSRGITQRQRHLMGDIADLLPHSKKDAKLDSKHQLPLLNELCDLASCNNALFFEARRRFGDLYLWAAKTPNGPSVRFHVLNAHTMDEMKMTGNCLKGSRPIVVFDKKFDETPHMALIKEVLSNIFAVPKTARKAKPFIDHVINFSIADGKIWFRNYQILDQPPTVSNTVNGTTSSTPAPLSKKDKKEQPKMSLSEIGPRFVLVPVKIFEGSFNGATIYENKEFVPPSASANVVKAQRASKYRARKGAQDERKVRDQGYTEARPKNELETRSVFA